MSECAWCDLPVHPNGFLSALALDNSELLNAELRGNLGADYISERLETAIKRAAVLLHIAAVELVGVHSYCSDQVIGALAGFRLLNREVAHG